MNKEYVVKAFHAGARPNIGDRIVSVVDAKDEERAIQLAIERNGDHIGDCVSVDTVQISEGRYKVTFEPSD